MACCLDKDGTAQVKNESGNRSSGTGRPSQMSPVFGWTALSNKTPVSKSPNRSKIDRRRFHRIHCSATDIFPSTPEAIPKPEMSCGVGQTVSRARRLGSWRTASARVTEATPRTLSLITSRRDHMLYGFQPCSFNRRPKTTMSIVSSGIGIASCVSFSLLFRLHAGSNSVQLP